jgi:hypothetical protein
MRASSCRSRDCVLWLSAARGRSLSSRGGDACRCRLSGYLSGRLVVWLSAWLSGCLDVWLSGCLVVWLSGCLTVISCWTASLSVADGDDLDDESLLLRRRAILIHVRCGCRLLSLDSAGFNSCMHGFLSVRSPAACACLKSTHMQPAVLSAKAQNSFRAIMVDRLKQCSVSALYSCVACFEHAWADMHISPFWHDTCTARRIVVRRLETFEG